MKPIDCLPEMWRSKEDESGKPVDEYVDQELPRAARIAWLPEAFEEGGIAAYRDDGRELNLQVIDLKKRKIVVDLIKEGGVSHNRVDCFKFKTEKPGFIGDIFYCSGEIVNVLSLDYGRYQIYGSKCLKMKNPYRGTPVCSDDPLWGDRKRRWFGERYGEWPIHLLPCNPLNKHGDGYFEVSQLDHEDPTVVFPLHRREHGRLSLRGDGFFGDLDLGRSNTYAESEILLKNAHLLVNSYTVEPAKDGGFAARYPMQVLILSSLDEPVQPVEEVTVVEESVEEHQSSPPAQEAPLTPVQNGSGRPAVAAIAVLILSVAAVAIALQRRWSSPQSLHGSNHWFTREAI